LASVLESRVEKAFTALSDAGFLVVGADGGVDVVVDDVWAAAGVDGVEAVVIGSIVDIWEPLSEILETLGFAADSNSGDVS
jgi:hypothetical protein